MEIFNLSALFNKKTLPYKIKCICILLSLVFSFCFSTKIYAEESLSAETGNSDQRSFESRVANPEPDFFFSGSSSELKGFYFGVGFRNVSLQVANDVNVSDSDGTANGIGTNLGYFWEEQALEYERQISIINH